MSLTVVIVVRCGYYCPCTFEFCTVVMAARKWLDPVLAIQTDFMDSQIFNGFILLNGFFIVISFHDFITFVKF